MGLGRLDESLLRMRLTAEYFGKRTMNLSRGLGSLAGIALGFMIRALTDLGRFTSAAELVDKAKLISEKEGALSTVITGVSIGYLHDLRGEHDDAVHVLSEIYEFARGAQLRLMLPVVQTYLGAAYLRRGNPELAAPMIEKAIDEANKMKCLCYHSIRLGTLARAELALGKSERALSLATTAVRSAVEQNEEHSEIYAILALVEVLTKEPEKNMLSIWRLIRGAYKRSRRLGLDPSATQCEMALLHLHRALGNDARAERVIQRIHKSSKRMGTSFFQKDILLTNEPTQANTAFSEQISAIA
jgi:tetratricopeptide (TPR) repeat protein